MKKILLVAFVMSSIFLFANICFADLISGRVAYYSFDGNANDLSGNNNNGTVYGATLTSDRFGNQNSAYRFNGVSDYISVADSASLRSFSQITLTAWIDISGFGYVPGNTWLNRPIITKGFFDYGMNLSHPSNLIAARLANDSMQGAQLDCFDNLKFNSWYFLSFVYDGTEMISYLDGKKMGTGYFNGDILKSNMPLLIGKNATTQYSYTPFYFDGIIDDISIYNHPLLSSEIQELSNNRPVPEPSSVFLLGGGLVGVVALRRKIK